MSKQTASMYWSQLMRHLWATEDFEDFAKTEEVVWGNKGEEIKEATEQIAACDRKIAKLLKRLTLISEVDDYVPLLQI